MSTFVNTINPTPFGAFDSDTEFQTEADLNKANAAMANQINQFNEQTAFERDLMGRKGMLNMILSDTYARPWRRHDGLYKRRRRYKHYPLQYWEEYGDKLWYPFLGPLFGLMITDFYLIQKQSLSNKDVYSLEDNGKYYYSSGWQIKAIYSLFIAFVVYFRFILWIFFQLNIIYVSILYLL